MKGLVLIAIVLNGGTVVVAIFFEQLRTTPIVWNGCKKAIVHVAIINFYSHGNKFWEKFTIGDKVRTT